MREKVREMEREGGISRGEVVRERWQETVRKSAERLEESGEREMVREGGKDGKKRGMSG